MVDIVIKYSLHKTGYRGQHRQTVLCQQYNWQNFIKNKIENENIP